MVTTSVDAVRRALYLAVAVMMIAAVLTVARPTPGAVDIPVVGDMADLISVSVAGAHHEQRCTTTTVTRYTERGYPYQSTKTTCTTISHPPPRQQPDVNEGSRALVYAGAAILAGTVCTACAVAITGTGVLDAFIPDSWANRNPTCNPGQTGIANCAR